MMAEIIVIGQVESTLPSIWMRQNEKNAADATPHEIVEAEGLFTDSIIRGDRVLKGDYSEPTLRIRTFVGETEQVRWVDDTQLSYKQKQVYLLFLKEDNGPAAQIEPGYYKAVNALDGVYEIVDGKAISGSDEWVLEELIAYIQNSLSAEALSPTLTPTPTELLIETLTPFSTETVTPTP